MFHLMWINLIFPLLLTLINDASSTPTRWMEQEKLNFESFLEQAKSLLDRVPLIDG